MKTYFGNNTVVELLPFEKSHSEQVENKIVQIHQEGGDDPFVIGDLGDIIRKYRLWGQTLPRVKPFYAVKCNDDFAVLKLLADLGASFDCASKGEIQKVLNQGVSTSRIIYANPCKQASFLRYAAKHNVSLMTFDNEAELYKVKDLYPSAKLVIRMLPPTNFKVQCELGMKFGCLPSQAEHLLVVAKSLDLDVVGVSFHVGSGCEEANAFGIAIQQARDVFDKGLQLGFDMKLLDIGGGFPGQESAPVTFGEIAQVVNMALDKYFPEDSVQIIAEPGRYFVASAFTIGVNVIAKRVVPRDRKGEHGEPLEHSSSSDEPSVMYYVNDGVYGSFNCLLFDHATVHVSVLKDSEDEMVYESSVWGPTCDGLDCILETTKLPELEVGDWMYFKDMGAYTMASASTFNGMPAPVRSYHCLDTVWHEVYPESSHKPVSRIRDIPKMKVGRALSDTHSVFEEMMASSPVEGFIDVEH